MDQSTEYEQIRYEQPAGAIYLCCLPSSDFVTGEVLTCAGGV